VNAEKRLTEARDIAGRMTKQGVDLVINMDHVSIFADPPRQVTSPIRPLGYIPAWDGRCYLSPVDSHELLLVACGLPAETPMRAEGWYENIAAVSANDQASYDYVMAQDQGNPHIHHMAMSIVPPPRGTQTELEYAYRLVPFIADVRHRIAQGVGEKPGNLILALPEVAVKDPEFRRRAPEMLANIEGTYQIEAMQGGGFLLQFFVLGGGRIEVVLRSGTTQAFNPASVDTINKKEISMRGDLVDKPIGA
jgi:hypothetical protein